MEVPSREVLSRMPLAEAVLLLLSHVTDSGMLDEIWEQHRGRCYERSLEFKTLVSLLGDALLKENGSGHKAFLKHTEGSSSATLQAIYGKLRRLPLEVSEAFLLQATQSLRALYPQWAEYELPASLQSFAVIKLDGKALKRVAKRLKSTRGTSGGLLGGRALVALNWSTGLATAMKTHQDGEANDVKFTGDLVPVIQELEEIPILYVADRAFCDLTQPRHFSSRPGDHFLVRYHSKTRFYLDESVASRTGTTHDDQTYVETWGYLGAEKNRHRLRVRRIEIQRPEQPSIILITDLLDAQEYAAMDLIWMYRQRWDIERVFQQVTEVFHLKRLIGSTAKASVFQFSFCLLLFNLTQVVRACIAQGADIEPEEISNELLFDDIQTHLKCWDLMIEREQTLDYFSETLTPARVRQRLRKLLGNCWTELWRKSVKRDRVYKPMAKRAKSHGSVYRMELAQREKDKQNSRKKKKEP